MVYTLSVDSVRIPRKLKEAEKLGIKLPRFLREALEEEVRRRKLTLLARRLDEVCGALERIDVERFTKHIREDREGR